MPAAIRILVGIGLFAFGFHVGRTVGRMEPLSEELRALRRRQGVIIDGEKVEPERRETPPGS
jgi:hypothetical protein